MEVGLHLWTMLCLLMALPWHTTSASVVNYRLLMVGCRNTFILSLPHTRVRSTSLPLLVQRRQYRSTAGRSKHLRLVQRRPVASEHLLGCCLHHTAMRVATAPSSDEELPHAALFCAAIISQIDYNLARTGSCPDALDITAQV